MNRAQSKDTQGRGAALAVITELRKPAVKHSLQSVVPLSMSKYLTPERIERLLLTAMQRQPILLQCTPESIVKSVVDVVSLGLDPSGVLGEAYLVPFYNSQKRAYEAQPIPGYRGLISIARRSGEIETINAQIVYSNDTFDLDLAGSELPSHRPGMPDRGDPIALYCVARFKGGGHYTEYMTVAEINEIRDRSNGYKQAQSKGHGRNPWITDWGQMARKTIIRRACHYWPMSTEMAEAFAMEDKTESVYDSEVRLQEMRTDRVQEEAVDAEIMPNEPTETGPKESEILSYAMEVHEELIERGAINASQWAKFCLDATGKKRPENMADIEAIRKAASGLLEKARRED